MTKINYQNLNLLELLFHQKQLILSACMAFTAFRLQLFDWRQNRSISNGTETTTENYRDNIFTDFAELLIIL